MAYLKFPREYTRLLLVEDDDSMVLIKDFEDVLMKKYLAVGDTLGLTERDLIILVFKNIPGQVLLVLINVLSLGMATGQPDQT